jgi:hypothetical protein
MEIIANAVQTVAANQNVYFTDTVACGGCSIVHREGSGLVTLRGLTNQCRARYKVTFNANVAIPTGGTVGPISLAVAAEGEPLVYSTMISTPTAVENFNNIGTTVVIDVPRGCCYSIAIRNIGTDPIVVENANLIVERIA